MLTLDTTPDVQPLPRTTYVDVCVVEDNPWRHLFESGTAGATTTLFCAERLSNGAPYQFLRLENGAKRSAHSHKQDLDSLITLLRPSIAQVAAAFGVSRQRIYDWRSGAGMSPQNAEQMSALLAAAGLLSAQSAVPLSQLGDKSLGNGRTFWTEIASGTSPVDAAAALLKILERDERERSALRRALAGRKVVKDAGDILLSQHLAE